MLLAINKFDLFNAFSILSEVFKFSRVRLIIIKVLGSFELKIEAKGRSTFSFTFVNAY